MIEGPLTYGQLSVWQDLRELTPATAQAANAAYRFSLPPGLAEADVRSLIGAVTRWHPSLRTAYRQDADGMPVQVVEPSHLPALEVMDHPDIAGRHACLTALREKAFTLDQPPVRWTFSRVPTAASEQRDALLFVKHHIVADYNAVVCLRNDLYAWLAGQRQAPAHPSPDLLTLARAERSPAGRARSERSMAYFERFAVPPATASDRDLGPGFDLTAECGHLGAAARRKASSARVSSSTVYAAAFARALAPTVAGDAMSIRLMASNRNLASYRYAVASINQWVPARLRKSAAVGDPDLASIERALLQAYRHGVYDVTELECPPTDVSYNFIGNWLDPTPACRHQVGDLPEITVVPAATVIGGRSYLRVLEGQDGGARLTLRMHGLMEEEARDVVRRLCEWLIN